MNRQYTQITEGMLFTDMYQFTMAQVYFRANVHEKRASFDHFFRNYPNYGEHQAGYCVNAGMSWFVNWMKDLRFDDDSLAFLRSETNAQGKRVFQDDFLDYLKKNGNFESLKIQAIDEGRVVHPNTPLTVVEGPLAIAQIIETPLLNALNFQTLIATKAARIRHSVGSNLLMEFGLRRAHGLGGNQGARAALIGGCDYTSNTGLSYEMGLPPKGTHSHAMVQTWLALGMTELDAFRAYADLYPNDTLLLVDTIDTLGSGLPNAIKVFEELRQKGCKPVGVRLDSGDLAYLSVQVAKMLNQAGFPDTCIVLSNDLDELTICQIHDQIRDEASRNHLNAEEVIRRLSYGVGTKLITSSGQSALGGVYKLVALENNGQWVPAIKLSNSMAKVVNPGRKKAWRVYDKRGRATADLVGFNHEHPEDAKVLHLHHPSEKGVLRTLSSAKIDRVESLLHEVWNEGKVVRNQPSLQEMRQLRIDDINALDSGVRRLRNPHVYHVSLTTELLTAKIMLMDKLRASRDQLQAGDN